MKGKVIDISYSGSGVCKDGKVFFVPYVTLGEEVEFEEVDEHKSYSNCKLTSVLLPSNARIQPKCPYFSKCHGCDFQFVTYDEEIRLKTKILQNELKKVQNFGEKTINFVKSSRFGYRNKIKLSYQNGALGYVSGQEVTKIESCDIANKDINKMIVLLQDFVKKSQFKYLKNVTLQKFDERVSITFLFSKEEKIENFDALKSCDIFVAVGEILESEKTKIKQIYGKKPEKTCKKLHFSVDNRAFFQINDEIAEKLYSHILNQIDDKIVVNAYSGQGVLTKLIAQKVKKVFGIEAQKSAHLIAESIKSENMINFCAKVEDKLTKDFVLKENVGIVILDPAREGCQKSVLDAIMASNVQKIVYVSCNFSTLVRDLKVLSESYDILDVTAFDMFPCTANIETCVTMFRK